MKTSTTLEIVVATTAAVMVFGTLAYHALEGWGYIDSFYFTGVTVTTIGYGDLYPATALGKIFTVFFAFGGVSIMLFALSMFATQYFERREKKMGILLEREFLSDLGKMFSKNGNKKRRRDLIKGTDESFAH